LKFRCFAASDHATVKQREDRFWRILLQSQLFYEFHLGDAVPEDHLVRKIDAALDLSWLRSELAPH